MLPRSQGSSRTPCDLERSAVDSRIGESAAVGVVPILGFEAAAQRQIAAVTQRTTVLRAELELENIEQVVPIGRPAEVLAGIAVDGRPTSARQQAKRTGLVQVA